MALNIQVLQGSDGVSSSRSTINQNFSTLKTASESLLNLLNTDNATLSGLSSITVENVAVSLGTSVLGIGNSATIQGSLYIGTESQATSISLLGTGGLTITNGGLTLGNGNINVNLSTAGISSAGYLNVSGEDRKPGITNGFSNAIDTNITTPVAIVVTSLKYLVVKNTNTSLKSTSLATGTAGQILDIILTDDISGNGGVEFTNIISIKAGSASVTTNKVVLTHSGDSIRVVYEGGNWYLLNAMPISLLTGTNSVSISV